MVLALISILAATLMVRLDVSVCVCESVIAPLDSLGDTAEWNLHLTQRLEVNCESKCMQLFFSNPSTSMHSACNGDAPHEWKE